MAFIKTTTLTTASNTAAFGFSNNTALGVACKNPEKLKNLLQAIAPGKDVHFVSESCWNLHDLVLSLAKKYAPVKMYLSTYAIRETPIRQLVLALQDGIITELNMLLDYRAQVRTPEVYQLANLNCTRIGLKAVHAKVCVLIGEGCSIAIVGSANFTTNPKIEAGVVSFHPETANFHKEWILKLIADAT